jgi:hypothetical protein
MGPVKFRRDSVEIERDIVEMRELWSRCEKTRGWCEFAPASGLERGHLVVVGGRGSLVGSQDVG